MHILVTHLAYSQSAIYRYQDMWVATRKAHISQQGEECLTGYWIVHGSSSHESSMAMYCVQGPVDA